MEKILPLVAQIERAGDRLGANSMKRASSFVLPRRIDMPRTVTVDMLALGQGFEQWCLARGKTRSAAIRELVGAALGAERVALNASKWRIEESDRVGENNEPSRLTRRRRITLSLAEDEITRLREQSAAAGMPAGHYLVCLLACVEKGRFCVAGKDAVRALVDSNFQLAWIGRSMSEIARKSANPPPETEREQVALDIHQAVEHLRRHLASAAAVLADVEVTRRTRRSRPQRMGRRPKESE